MSDPTLNLSAWIDRRAKYIGPYSDHIVHSVKHYEAHIETQAARIERLEAALVEAMITPEALIIAGKPLGMSDDVWEQMVTSVGKSRAALFCDHP
jgi:hypothetical protein